MRMDRFCSAPLVSVIVIATFVSVELAIGGLLLSFALVPLSLAAAVSQPFRGCFRLRSRARLLLAGAFQIHDLRHDP